MKKILLFLIFSICFFLLPVYVFADQHSIAKEKKFPIVLLMGHQGTELVFINSIENLFAGDAAEKLNLLATTSISNAIVDYCKNKGWKAELLERKSGHGNPYKLPYCNAFEGLVNDLKKISELDIYIPKYKIETTSVTKGYSTITYYNTKPEMTLVEKEKFPIIVFIENYSSKILYEGQSENPSLFKREGIFNGKIVLDVNILIEIKSAKSMELIDRIEIQKKYESKPVYVKGETPFLGSPKLINDNRQEVLVELLDQFYSDLLNIFISYDWNTPFKIIQKQ